MKQIMAPISRPLIRLGITVTDFYNRMLNGLEGFGQFALFTWSAINWFFRGVSRWCQYRLLMPLFFEIGTMSIMVICITGAFIGMVLAVEAYDQFAAIGQEARLGGIINISVVKQIGPVLAAVMLAGRIGGSVAAELGTMRVTEQLDALRVMGTDPIAHLVVPRVVACAVMIPILTIFSDLIGMAGGYFWTCYIQDVNPVQYWEFSSQFVRSFDVVTGLVKSVIFGSMIGMISCYKGFYCRPGAAGVGSAATDAFVTSFIAIIISNMVMAKFLKDLYFLVFGYGTATAFSG